MSKGTLLLLAAAASGGARRRFGASGVPSALLSIVEIDPTSGILASDGTATYTVTVTLFDDGLNPVEGVDVILESDVAGPVIAPSSGTSDVNGLVVFTVTSLGAGTFVFTATDTTNGIILDDTPSGVFGIEPSTSTVEIDGGDDTFLTGTSIDIIVTLLDGNGNPVSGHTVSLAADPAGPSITPPSGVSDGSGQVTFAVESASAIPEGCDFTATDSTQGVAVAQTAFAAWKDVYVPDFYMVYRSLNAASFIGVSWDGGLSAPQDGDAVGVFECTLPGYAYFIDTPDFVGIDLSDFSEAYRAALTTSDNTRKLIDAAGNASLYGFGVAATSPNYQLVDADLTVASDGDTDDGNVPTFMVRSGTSIYNIDPNTTDLKIWDATSNFAVTAATLDRQCANRSNTSFPRFTVNSSNIYVPVKPSVSADCEIDYYDLSGTLVDTLSVFSPETANDYQIVEIVADDDNLLLIAIDPNDTSGNPMRVYHWTLPGLIKTDVSDTFFQSFYYSGIPLHGAGFNGGIAGLVAKDF